MKKARQMKLLTATLLPSCILVSVIITLYPLVSNSLAERNKSLVLTEYTEAVEETADTDITEMLVAAQEYNAALIPSTISADGAFSEEALLKAEENYTSLLNVNGSGIMGYVEIPRIDVYLPIYHGTGSDALDHGAGHLLGSSLPIGGESTHAVIAAHSGLARAKLFTDLDQLETGDVFYIHTLNQTLAYEVDQIKTVLPEDTSDIAITPGEDYVTLITCTPYGVNTHRLLIRGHRVPCEEAETVTETVQEAEASAPSTWTREYIKGIIIGLALLAAGAVTCVVIARRGKRGAHEKR